MAAVDIDVSETFALIEEINKIPLEPEMYRSVKSNLKAYRQKVMTDLVGGRVGALLDAGHDSLVKYKAKLSGLNTVVYLYKNLRRNVMAMRFKGLDIGEGQYSGIGTSFDAPITEYPMSAPYAVPQRLLPQVDYFKFVPHDDLSIGATTDLAQLKAFVRIQTELNAFIDNPEMENAVNDFFFFYPQCKVRGRWTFIDPTEVGFNAWNGEYILFTRELRTEHIETTYEYSTFCWFNVDIERTIEGVDKRENNPVIQFNMTYRREHDAWIDPSEAPEIEFGVGGRDIKSSDERVYAMGSRVTEPLYGTQLVTAGMVLRSLSFGVDTTEVVWYNHWETVIEVNNPLWGSTNPPADTYTDTALHGYEITANALGGHAFDHWEIDGVDIGNTNPYFHYPLKDVIIKAVFT